MSKLRERMIQDLRLRNVAESTIVCYVRAVRQYAEYFGKSPDQLNSKHLRQYLLHLIEEKKVPQGTYNQKVAALRFFYRETVKQPAYVEGVCFTRKERKLPVVLSHDEVRRFLLFCLSWTLSEFDELEYSSSQGVHDVPAQATFPRAEGVDCTPPLARERTGIRPV